MRRRRVKGLKWVGILVVLAAVVVALISAMNMGEKSPVIAAGTIAIADDLKADAKQVEHFFVIVYDEDSPMPMPFGAMKEAVPADISVPVPFTLTKESLRIMNPDAPPPKKLRLKARFDLDGVAGPDQPGDLVGQTEHVDYGSSQVQILIDKKVP